MKVTGPRGPFQPAALVLPGRQAALACHQGAAAPASASSASSATAGVTGMSALMALQGVEDATERRRRAIRRGGGLLDRLDELRLAMLSGESGGGALERLSRGLREDRPEDPDVELSGLLDQIDLRAAVELAKAEVRRNAT